MEKLTQLAVVITILLILIAGMAYICASIILWIERRETSDWKSMQRDLLSKNNETKNLTI